MNKYLLYVFLLLICLVPLNVKADCSDASISQLKEKANNIKIEYYHDADATYYDYDKGEEVKQDGVINLSLSGLDSSFYVVDNSSGWEIYPDSYENGKLIIPSVLNNYKEYDIYSTECVVKLRSISISIPNYNKYHDDPICDGIEDDFELCGEFVTENVDYDTLKKKADEYKEDNAIATDKTSDNKAVKAKNNIFDFISKYLVFIIIGVIVLILVSIIIVKRIRNRSVLE